MVYVINLYELFCVDTLRYNSTARKIIDSIPDEELEVTVNFEDIVFASRGFLKELISGLRYTTVKFINVDNDIMKMVEVVIKDLNFNDTKNERK